MDDIDIISLLERAVSLAGSTGDVAVAERLRRSVVRPLAAVVGDVAADPSVADDELWRLSIDATRLRAAEPTVLPLHEATAALQDIAIQLAADDAERESRLAELTAAQAELPTRFQSQPNGPYLVTNAPRVENWLGVALPTRPQLALCRCGASAMKPYCDGSHAANGFTDARDPDRVPNRRDAYAGLQVTVYDNRGICQHSGFCSDRLSTVFRVREEPFVAPSGGRMDEIVRAVRACPSGALSYGIDAVEARDDVDHHGRRPAAIEVSKDGPYRITGGIPLVNAEGADEPRAAGSSREHYALCRCGQSQNKPFCSGAHWYADFSDPATEAEPTIFEWAGGFPALLRMTTIFYAKYVPEDPLLAPLFASMSPDHPERVARWLGEVFCGPKEYSERYGGYERMVSQHIGKGLTEERRERWVQLILRSAHEAGLPADPEFRAAFSAYIEWGSRLALENSQPGARPPAHMPMPRWDWQTAAGPPGSRISALRPPEEETTPPVVLPGPSETVSFEKHVRTLFRDLDRRSMRSSFDLWSYDDVKQHAHAILERVRAGTMPCDGAWPAAQVDALERWVDSGMRP
jgi:CDGSH-type Zn-finger protein/truncated hemoglobin YjbI